MKLQDFLKVNKVKLVGPSDLHLTNGKHYTVLGVTDRSCIVNDDNGCEAWADMNYFEPVLDLEENQLQNAELTPEFEAVEPVIADNCEVNIQDNSVNTKDNSVNIQDTPKFKVGDPVYCPSLLDGRIYKARKNNNYLGDGCKLFVANEHEDCFDFEVDGSNQYNNPIVYHANEETRQALQVLHPDIEFEQPPKELKGSDLCFEKLRNGKKLVMCAVSDLSDEKAIKRLEDDYGCIRIISDCDTAPYSFIDTHGIRYGFAVPLNGETGEPLTQAVLDE